MQTELGERNVFRLMTIKNLWPLLAACLLTAVLQTLIFLNSPLIANDGVSFIRFAQHLDQPQTNLQQFSQHPGYPHLIRIAHAATPSWLFKSPQDAWIFAARLVAMIAGVLLVAVVWGITRHMYGELAANVACCLTAIWPVMRANASDALSDTPHLVAFLGAAWLFCAGLKRRSTSWFAATGAVSGIAYWIRPEGWSIWLVAIAFLSLNYVLSLLRREPAESRPKIRWALATGVSALLVATPCLMANGLVSRKVTDKLTNFMAHAEQNLKVTVEQKESSTAESQSDVLVGAGAASTELNASLGTCFAQVITRLAERAHFLLLFSLLTILVTDYQRLMTASFVYLLMLFALHFVMLIWLFKTAGYVDRRHVMPLIAILIPSAAKGVVLIGVGLARLLSYGNLSAAKWAAPATTWGLVAIFAVVHCPEMLEPLHDEQMGTYETIAWAEQNVPLDTLVVTNSPHARLYLDHQTTRLPARGGIADTAKATGGRDYVVLVAQGNAGEHFSPEVIAPYLAKDSLYEAIDKTNRHEFPVNLWRGISNEPTNQATRLNKLKKTLR